MSPPTDDRGSERSRIPAPSPRRAAGPGSNAGRSGAAGLPGGRSFLWVVLGLLAVNLIFSSLVSRSPSRVDVPYTVFRTQVEKSNVTEVTSRGDTIQGTFRDPVTYPEGKKGTTSREFQTQRPAFADDELLQTLIAKNVVVNARPLEKSQSFLVTLLLGFGPMLLFLWLFVRLARRFSPGGAGGIGGFGRSRAKRYDASGRRSTFAEVAGIEDAKEELVEVVDFLKNPDRYRRLGGAIPRGVLLMGSPGTGKTLLARAVAGEANVPFFSVSASEFIEMIVGVGASRVRDLFEQAKKEAPAIIFIDELDAIGRARGAASGLGGHDEREQTLNQILTEMDGFTGSEGVIVVAATNRPEVLDPALLRPGRFDRRVFVSPPDREGRAKILAVHTRGVALAKEVDLEAIAAATPGMVGADLQNLVNEAALTAARRNHERVQSADFTEALEKIMLGAERKIVLSPLERERTAFHEAGHALLGMLQPGADPVRKVSIVPRGRALGVTFQSPESDRYAYDTGYLRGRIIGALGGRAAEEIVYGDVTTGAESDLEQVTSIARQMVGRWGMSEKIGLVVVFPRPENGPAFAFPGSDGVSERTRELVDEEVRRIVSESYDQAKGLLSRHRPQLDSLARELLACETLDEADAYAAAGVARESGQVAAFSGPPSPDSLKPDLHRDARETEALRTIETEI